MTMVQAYTRFMIAFFLVVGSLSIIRPLSDAGGSGLIYWPEAARSLGIFLVNWFHFVLHLILGAWAIYAFRRTESSRLFAKWVFGICVALVLIGLFTVDGIWLIPADFAADAQSGQIVHTAKASWYGYIPANPADDLINGLVALSGFVFGFLPVGYRPWGFWRAKPATA